MSETPESRAARIKKLVEELNAATWEAVCEGLIVAYSVDYIQLRTGTQHVIQVEVSQKL